MGRVFQQLVPENSTLFAPLLDLMVSPNLARNLALETLVQVLKGLELPEKWEGEPVFAALRPKAAPESGSSLVPGTKPPYLKRTWRRWKRSIQKRIGRRRT